MSRIRRHRRTGAPGLEVHLWAPRAAPTLGAARGLTQGVVVDNVNVSDLLYAPVRSAWLAPIS